MDITELCTIAYENAVSKGFYDSNPSFGALLMQVVEELGEASDADRKGKRAEDGIASLIVSFGSDRVFTNNFISRIKDTTADELADAFIILAGICKHMDIDIESAIICKMRYNRTRERLHGKEY